MHVMVLEKARLDIFINDRGQNTYILNTPAMRVERVFEYQQRKYEASFFFNKVVYKRMDSRVPGFELRRRKNKLQADK